jgi:hypothetical protein
LLDILGGVYAIPGTAIDFPMQILWLGVLGAALHYTLFHTRFGYHSRFTGASAKSAKYMKIAVDEVKIVNFGLVALLAAFGGIGQAVWAGSVSPGTGSGLELVVIAAVVIGGTDLFGGEGTIVGVVLGALVFSLTQNILVLAGLGAQMFSVFTGIFIIAAVLIEQVAKASFRDIATSYAANTRSIATSPATFFATYEALYRPEDQSTMPETDRPFRFLFLTWAIASLFTIATVNIVDSLLPLDFSLFIINPGLASFVTVPLILFLLIAFLFLLTTLGMTLGSKLTDEPVGIFSALPLVAYSFLPALLLFIPVLLIGFSFLVPLIAVGILLVLVPVFALLLIGTKNSLETSIGSAATVVGTTFVVVAAILAFFATNI